MYCRQIFDIIETYPEEIIMPIQIIPFGEDHLAQAGELLALRHQRNRLVCPSLPQAFEEPLAARQAVAFALRRPYAAGFAALDGSRLKAYLLGDMVFDKIWGRAAWVRSAGWAALPDAGYEVLQDLYAATGERWLSYGVLSHFLLAPRGDSDLLQAWFSLGFGVMHVHALLDLSELASTVPEVPPGLELRKAGNEDSHYLFELADLLWQQQVQAPSWSPINPEYIQENRELWASQVDEADMTIWLALRDERILGSQGYWPPETDLDELYHPQHGAYMSLAAVQPDARRQGIGTLLTRQVLADASANGYRTMETNWRGSNLLASRFWPRRGYQPVMVRLARHLDPRILWARGR
jgi:ribosomal protein S18 acetylase RimI-like enzyme